MPDDCGERCEVYSRVCGYYRPVENWNPGKQEEFRERVDFKAHDPLAASLRGSGWPIAKIAEYRRIVKSFDFFTLPDEYRKEILECLHDPAWDWWEESDGCTAVSEPGWPSKYFPPCVRHDYDWQTGRGGWVANARFRRLNRAYCMESWRANARWAGVTISWFVWFKWVKMFGGRRVPPKTTPEG
jgi:ribonucleoside-triphosphate reductase